MRIEWATVCLGIADAETGTDLYGVGLDTTTFDAFPGEMPLRVAVCVALSYYEALHEDSAVLIARVTDTKMRVMLHRGWTVPFQMKHPDKFYEGWESRGMVEVTLPLTIPEPSTCTIELRTDEGAAPVTLPYRFVLRDS